MIVTSNSYSSNVGLAIEVVTALYKAGVLLLIYDAEKLLRILREGDYVRYPHVAHYVHMHPVHGLDVRLVPDSYHIYGLSRRRCCL